MPDEGDIANRERKTFGTVPLEAPATRDDLERAVRYLHLSDLEQRDLVLRLAAQLVALTEALGVDGAALEPRVAAALDRIRASDARTRGRVWLEPALEDKYAIASASPPCEELLHLCGARCCQMDFPLSTVDLDEGVIRWDYGQPYMIRQRASDGFCVHNDPTSHGCTVHAQRPAACRRYDCRHDERVWIDYERRIPAPLGTLGDGRHDVESFDLMERVKLRAAAEAIESNAVTRVYPDDVPHEGPALAPRSPRASR